MARSKSLTATVVPVRLASGKMSSAVRHKNLNVVPTSSGPTAGPANVQADSAGAALGVKPAQEQPLEASRVPDNHISSADRRADFDAYMAERDAEQTAYAAAYWENREDEEDEDEDEEDENEDEEDEDEDLSDAEQTARYNTQIAELDHELEGIAEALTTAEMVVTSDYDFNVSAHVLEFTDVRTGLQVRQFFDLDDYISSAGGLAELAGLVAERDAEEADDEDD